MIKIAIILAAGLGSRLNERTEHIPKGFLQIDDKTLIVMSIDKLLDAGIEEIIIGQFIQCQVQSSYRSLKFISRHGC